MLNKYCYKCQETKPFDAFGRNKSKKDGLSTECRECKRQGDKAYYMANSEQVKQTVAKYRQKNPEKVKEVKKNCYRNNSKLVKLKVKEWIKSNPEKYKQSQKKYKQKNLSKFAAFSAKYRSSKFQATPLWFEKDLVDIVYAKAKEWGFEVDHIVPLQGKTVCGLHCWGNLQLLDKNLNSGKKNYYWPDMS
jgi:hypothetical protein